MDAVSEKGKRIFKILPKIGIPFASNFYAA